MCCASPQWGLFVNYKKKAFSLINICSHSHILLAQSFR
jgi:hypothetical protein